jgi:hypothetical protein
LVTVPIRNNRLQWRTSCSTLEGSQLLVLQR